MSQKGATKYHNHHEYYLNVATHFDAHERSHCLTVWCLTHMTEPLHFLQNLVDIWHHVLAVHHDGRVGAVPQSNMEHSTALDMHSVRKQNPQKYTFYSTSDDVKRQILP